MYGIPISRNMGSNSIRRFEAELIKLICRMIANYLMIIAYLREFWVEKILFLKNKKKDFTLKLYF